MFKFIMFKLGHAELTINPFMPNDFPISINNWMSSFPILGLLDVIFIFI